MTLYKYLKPERIDILHRSEIRFTQPGALNDPFELRPRFETLISEAEALASLKETPVDLEPMLREAYSMLPNEQCSNVSYESFLALVRSVLATDEARATMARTFLAVFDQMKDIAPPLREQLYQLLNSNVGMLSLSEDPVNVLMWAHYADNHRGLVLGFDEKHEFFNRKRSQNDEFYSLRKVIYSDAAPFSSLLTLEDDAIFVTKGTKWEYEKEWRMLAPLRDATRFVSVGGDLVHLFAFPAEAIVSVIVGAKADPDLENDVRELVRSNAAFGHVTVSRAVFDFDNQVVLVP